MTGFNTWAQGKKSNMWNTGWRHHTEPKSIYRYNCTCSDVWINKEPICCSYRNNVYVPTIQIHNYTILNETWNKCVLLHSLYTSYLWPLLWWLSLIWGRRCHILPLWRPWSGTHKPYWASGCSLWLMWTWTSLWSRSGPSDPVQVINHILIKRKPPNIQLLCES